MRAIAAGLFFVVLVYASNAQAFSGVFVSAGRGRPTAGQATAVLMRDGDHTVVTLRQDYRGPPGDFALIVPVPASVTRRDVRTLAAGTVERVETLSAPRLVELWEADPCAVSPPAHGVLRAHPSAAAVEERFVVEEYDISVVRAPRAGGLLRWLRERGYRAPPELLRAAAPFAASGHHFLVARVDATRLGFRGGSARLSPLSFRYLSDEVRLPLGFTADPQGSELVVHMLAHERWGSADHDNVLVPTNLVVHDRARSAFDAVYATILDRVRARHPDAVVTEYAWPASSCAPCPTPPLGPPELSLLGRDAPRASGSTTRDPEGLFLTRLRARVERGARDLVLSPASSLEPRRRRRRRPDRPRAGVPRRAPPGAYQARYAVLHEWTAPLACASPERGRWGSPLHRRRPAPITARLTSEIIPTGQLRRFLLTWTPVLRIPSRGDAVSASLLTARAAAPRRRDLGSARLRRSR